MGPSATAQGAPPFVIDTTSVYLSARSICLNIYNQIKFCFQSFALDTPLTKAYTVSLISLEALSEE